MPAQANTAQPENGLVVLLKENNVSEETALAISPAFTELFDLTSEWNTKAKEYLNNPDLSDEERAKDCKKARLALVKVRTGIDKKRKELNDADQKRIADRNNAAKVLTALVTPTEALLEEVENKLENQEKERKTLLKNERLEKLKPFNVDCTFFDLENMPDEAFKILLENSSLAHQSRVEKEATEKRTSDRKEQLVLLGFKPHETGAYCHELFDVHEEITDYSDEKWKNFSDKLAKEISDDLEEKRKAKEAEETRLKAEKDESDRKLALLQQEQKEKEQKHNTAIYRQQAAARINIVLEYTLAHEMTEEGWSIYFNEKDKEYEAEQSRLFVEKKKAQIEEAKKKAEEERQEKEKRELALAPEKEKIRLALDQMVLPKMEFKSGDSEICYSQITARFEGFKKWANEQIDQLK